METKIRYYQSEDDVLYYSIKDVENFLLEKKAINSRYIAHEMRKLLGKRLSATCQYGFNSPLQVQEFDEFMNWVVFVDIYDICRKYKNTKEKIRSAKIIEAIDLSNLFLIEVRYPEIYKILKPITFEIKEL